MKIALPLFLLLVVCGCSSAHRRTAEGHQTLGKIVFTVSLPKYSTVGTAIPLKLTVANSGQDDIAINDWNRTTDLALYDARGRRVPRAASHKIDFMSSLPEGSSPAEAILFGAGGGPKGYIHQGQTLGTTIDLNAIFLLRPGKYTLTAFAFAYQLGRNIPYVRIRVSPVAFRIMPHDTNP